MISVKEHEDNETPEAQQTATESTGETDVGPEAEQPQKSKPEVGQEATEDQP